MNKERNLLMKKLLLSLIVSLMLVNSVYSVDYDKPIDSALSAINYMVSVYKGNDVINYIDSVKSSITTAANSFKVIEAKIKQKKQVSKAEKQKALDLLIAAKNDASMLSDEYKKYNARKDEMFDKRAANLEQSLYLAQKDAQQLFGMTPQPAQEDKVYNFINEALMALDGLVYGMGIAQDDKKSSLQKLTNNLEATLKKIEKYKTKKTTELDQKIRKELSDAKEAVIALSKMNFSQKEKDKLESGVKKNIQDASDYVYNYWYSRPPSRR